MRYINTAKNVTAQFPVGIPVNVRVLNMET